MSDLYNDIWLRRWSLSTTGQAECAEDAVNVTLLSPEDRQAVEAKNADIHQAIADVTALEAARLVPEPDVPEEIEVADEPLIDEETGEETPQSHMEPHPLWVAYAEAQAVIAAADADLLALERVRKSEPEEGDGDLVTARWGYAVEATQKPFLPDLWPADFKAILTISGYEQPLLDWIDTIDDVVQREFARSKLLNSAMYSRYDPMMLAGQQALGISDVELNALWMWAA